MDRKNEYYSLLSELDHTPPALDNTVNRARTRVKGMRRTRLLAIPVSSLFTFFIIFILMVNMSTSFALACARIPLLRELTAAVAFSPSLSAAVKNEYVQIIDMEQTENEITMRIEYVIVDQKQLHVFYTLSSGIYTHMTCHPVIDSSDNTPLEGFSVSFGDIDEQNDKLRRITVDFVNNDIPDSLRLICKVFDRGSDTMEMPVPVKDDLVSRPEKNTEPEYISVFEFLLPFDPAYTQQGDVINIDQTFVLDGQTLTATTVEIYPTHIRLNLKDDPGNTAWLKSLVFYLEDENGKRFEQVSNGITATGSEDTPMMCSFRIESSFFSECRHLTLYIKEAIWLDKDMERIRVDLKNVTADALPEDVCFKAASREGDNWYLTFTAKHRKDNALHQLFTTDYYDESESKYSFNGWSSTNHSYFDEETQMYAESQDVFEVQFALRSYPYDIVYLSPEYSRSVKLEQPVMINVK